MSDLLVHCDALKALKENLIQYSITYKHNSITSSQLPINKPSNKSSDSLLPANHFSSFTLMTLSTVIKSPRSQVRPGWIEPSDCSDINGEGFTCQLLCPCARDRKRDAVLLHRCGPKLVTPWIELNIKSPGRVRLIRPPPASLWLRLGVSSGGRWMLKAVWVIIKGKCGGWWCAGGCAGWGKEGWIAWWRRQGYRSQVSAEVCLSPRSHVMTACSTFTLVSHCADNKMILWFLNGP